MFLTHDSRWTHWHLSRLGEGGSLSAAIFNFSLTMAGLLVALLGYKMAEEIRFFQPHRGAAHLQAIFVFVGVCWLGVASFPFDKFQLIHHIFGYAQFAAIGYAMLRLQHLCPRFSARTYGIGYLAALTTGILMALFHLTHFTTLLIVELTGQFFIYIWILSMASDRHNDLQK